MGHPPSVRKKHGAEWGKSFRKSWYARGDDFRTLPIRQMVGQSTKDGCL